MSITTGGPVTASVPFADTGEDIGIERPRRSARRRFSIPGWYRLLSPVAVLVLWQVASASGLVSPEKVPSPIDVWRTAVELATTDSPAYGTLQGALAASLERMAEGFLLGVAVAMILAVIAGLSRVGETVVDPLMQMIRTVPLFGLVPVFIVWFGIGQQPKLLLIALGAGIPLYLNTFAGIRGVDPKLVEAGRMLGLNRPQMLRHVVLPGALPQILVGIRQSLGAAWLSLVVAEQLNTKAGLGFLINQATQFLQNDVIFVALIVYTILGLLTDWMVRIAERRALAWRHELVG
ncbi:MAG: ABC transporter permease [Nocardia sp.]|nr:ABC transporter permease [Nocardia sp.]